jgi:hypothetical protein
MDANPAGAPKLEEAADGVTTVPRHSLGRVDHAPNKESSGGRPATEDKRRPLEREMRTSRRRLVGVYLAASGVAVLAVLPWTWSTVSRVAAVKKPIQAHFLTVTFGLSPEAAVIMIVALMAVAGSLVATIHAFTNRAGQETLERGYLWWYLLRPLAAALLGVAFYLVVVAGLLSATGSNLPALAGAAAIGALAGLFTDQVLNKLRRALGQFDYAHAASGKSADKPADKPADKDTV